MAGWARPLLRAPALLAADLRGGWVGSTQASASRRNRKDQKSGPAGNSGLATGVVSAQTWWWQNGGDDADAWGEEEPSATDSTCGFCQGFP